jgi:hypothetical protein
MSLLCRYFLNFAQSHNATYSADGIHVCCMVISALIHGGDNVKGMEYDAEKNVAFQKKVGDEYVKAATAAKDAWVDEVTISE